MNKQLVILTVVPADLCFCSETEIWAENLRQYKLSDKAIVLVGINEETSKYRQYWYNLADKYTEIRFEYYDLTSIEKLIKLYIPIIRPYILKQFFENNPEFSDKVIYYVDSDVIFTKKFDFTPYLEDNTIYASNVSSYNDHHYFDSKSKDVMFHKRSEYSNIDVFDTATKLVGINRSIVEKSGPMGGCQYILKNIDSKFWDKVMTDCVKIRQYLLSINNIYFPSEELGIQSWCSDLWSMYWNLLLRGNKIECPQELDFAWATDPIEKWDKVFIYHNAGGLSVIEKKNKTKLFNKKDSKFVCGFITPFQIENWGDIDPNFCNTKYLDIIKEMTPNAVTKKKNILDYQN